jgi:hypothetical protein
MITSLGFFTGMLVVMGLFILGIITEGLAESISKETHLAAGEEPAKKVQ